MVLSDITRQRVEAILASYCAERVPEHLRDDIKLTYRIRTTAVTLYEERKALPDHSKWVRQPVAQLRFNPDLQHWKLYRADRNARWHRYDLARPAHSIEPLLSHLDSDPTGIFWG